MMIPFKAKAYLDLKARKETGEQIDQKNVNKHRTDVFRLLGMLAGDAQFALPAPVQADLSQFLALAGADAAFDPREAVGVEKI